jgi:hypothetical protein
MIKLGGKMLDAIRFARSRSHWAKAAAQADRADLPDLRLQRQRARQLRGHLDDLLFVADGRLALPLNGTNAVPRPHGSDWDWQPELWRGPLPQPGLASVQSTTMLGRDLTLFHDCDRSELTLRQLRNRHEDDTAPFGLRMDVFRFDGSFLSLVVDLPEQAVAGLQRRHLIRLTTKIALEKPIEIFARLNIRHGPNTEQIVRSLPLQDSDVMVEFDLAYSNMNEKRVEKAWVDLIFESPEMNQVTLRDLSFCRRPRAAL